jgi:DNA repair exonuclease SbcCD ATPase subunit
VAENDIVSGTEAHKQEHIKQLKERLWLLEEQRKSREHLQESFQEKQESFQELLDRNQELQEGLGWLAGEGIQALFIGTHRQVTKEDQEFLANLAVQIDEVDARIEQRQSETKQLGEQTKQNLAEIEEALKSL